MSKNNRNPKEETLSDMREALMNRMDDVESNLSRVIQRLFNEVNALRKENEMLRGNFAKQSLKENECVLQDLTEVDYDQFFSMQPEESTNTQQSIKNEKNHINSTRVSQRAPTFDDPLKESEADLL